MKRPTFKSSLATAMDEFVAFKIAQGYDYCSAAAKLRHFDRFILRCSYMRAYLTSDILDRYTSDTCRLAPDTRRGLLLAIHAFARWLSLLEPASCVAINIPARAPARDCHYLYSLGDVAAIMGCARRLDGHRWPLRPAAHATLVGLLYCTGLRIGEALALNVGDIDLDAGHLTVRRGKMGKARHVALADCALTAISVYLHARLAFHPNGPDSPLFLNTRYARMCYTTASGQFRALLRESGVTAAAPQPPRIHDLRHTFACECLRMWREQGLDVNAMLPILATAMGHTSIHDSQIYIHASELDLQKAADRFHDVFICNIQGAHP